MNTIKTGPPAFITGWQFRMLECRMLFRMIGIARSLYPDWRSALKAVIRQMDTHLAYQRITHLYKGVRIADKAYVQVTFPAIDSRAMDLLARNELLKNLPASGRKRGLNTLILAITKKCSLQCAHCYEWEDLNKREFLQPEEIIAIISEFQKNGVASIELSGGEPLNRFADLVRILEQSDTEASEFWILSSGYLLNESKARFLAHAGLRGICISVDHWDRDQHDAFRGMDGSFDWAMKAAHNAREAGLAVCFSLTPVRSFCNRNDLMQYAEMARHQGVHFIRIIEPRAVGHFEGMDVELRKNETDELEAFTKLLQTGRDYRQYPVVEYYGAYQRQAGCSGAGERFLYVDTNGDFHACPFCRNTCGNALTDTLEEGKSRLKLASGCHAFSNI